ncbi:MAG: hypothetical protein K2K57_09385 [Oscillospiraceae bacterium]|nr:hypothetical protein [Oscillospiraceae bacterium]
MNYWKKVKIPLIAIIVIIIFVIYDAVQFIPSYSDNGRRFSITIPEVTTFQMPAPKHKLIRYMTKKYKVRFHEYHGEEYLEGGISYEHLSSDYFEEKYNGIVVFTDEYPGHYFYVCDYYGAIHDDYGVHIAQSNAETKLMERLDKVIDEDVKIILHPNGFQKYIFDEYVGAYDYLEYGTYTIKIYISGKGENAEDDLEKIKEIIEPYWIIDRRVMIYYVDETVWNNVESLDFGTYKDNVIYNKRGKGWINSFGELTWEWIPG